MLASNAEYTIGLQQMANYPANTRVLINLGKWQQQLSEVQWMGNSCDTPNQWN